MRISSTSHRGCADSLLTGTGTRALPLVFFESVFQVFFEATVRQHFFEFAPRGLTAFGSTRLRSNAAFDFVEDSVVVGVVFRLGQKLFV
jgi:hypothetical protein